MFPLLLNYLVTRNSVFDYKVAGKPSDWIIFWVTYLSSIASLAMVVITWWTLKQNKIQSNLILQQNTNQLKELKRQWKEALKYPVMDYPKGDNAEDYVLGEYMKEKLVKVQE